MFICNEISSIKVFIGAIPWILITLLTIASVAIVQPEAFVLYVYTLQEKIAADDLFL